MYVLLPKPRFSLAPSFCAATHPRPILCPWPGEFPHYDWDRLLAFSGRQQGKSRVIKMMKEANPHWFTKDWSVAVNSGSVILQPTGLGEERVARAWFESMRANGANMNGRALVLENLKRVWDEIRSDQNNLRWTEIK